MTLSAPVALEQSHDASGFHCGADQLDRWIRERALKNQQFGASRTYVACDAAQVLGYYALAAGALQTSDTSGRFRRNMPDPIPVIILGRLAVDKSLQGQGIGRRLLQDAGLRVAAAAKIIGVRGLVVHALDTRAAEFYMQLGFDASPSNPLILAITLGDLIATIGD